MRLGIRIGIRIPAIVGNRGIISFLLRHWADFYRLVRLWRSAGQFVRFFLQCWSAKARHGIALSFCRKPLVKAHVGYTATIRIVPYGIVVDAHLALRLIVGASALRSVVDGLLLRPRLVGRNELAAWSFRRSHVWRRQGILRLVRVPRLLDIRLQILAPVGGELPLLLLAHVRREERRVQLVGARDAAVLDDVEDALGCVGVLLHQRHALLRGLQQPRLVVDLARRRDHVVAVAVNLVGQEIARRLV